MTDPNIDSFKDAMIRSGIPFAEEIIPDGKIHRFPTGKKNKKNGWYILFDNAGFYGDWSKSISDLWKVSLEGRTPREIAIINQDIKKSRKASEEETERRNQETAIEAENIWNNANETGVSEYLNIKKVSAFGIKYGSDQYGDFVAVPLMDVDGKLWNVQKIYNKKDDQSSNKRFLRGGKKKGCFHVIGTPLKELSESDKIWIVEGYATGASIHMATNDTVIVAFDAGSIDPVINAIKSTYPHLLGIIAGDDDQWPKDGNNAGRQKAEYAAKKYGCHVVFPKFQEDHYKFEPTDFNDLLCLEGIEAVQAQLSSGDSLDIWPDPLPLPKIDLLPVKSFDCDILLPKAFRAYVEDAARRAHVPPDLIAIPLVVSLSILLGRKYRIYPKQKDDWGVVPNLWGMIIARSGEKKSSCLEFGIKHLKRLAVKFKENLKAEIVIYAEALRLYENKLKILEDLEKKEQKRIIEEGLKGTSSSLIDTTKLFKIKNQITELTQNAPVQPVEKRFISNDTTIEKLHEILSNIDCNGIALVADELIGLLMGFEKAGHEQDRKFYLEGWNGNGSYQVDRISRGSPYAENICLSVLGGTQPEKIQAYISKNTSPLHNDGLIQRFQLMVYPDQLKDFKYVDQYANTQAKNKVFEITEIIESSTFLENSQEKLDESSDIEIINFRFDYEAQELFKNWYTDLKARMTKEVSPVIEEHLSKYASLIPSLALIFHVTSLAEKNAIKATPVSKDALEMAIEWDGYLEPHMRRVYNTGTNIAPRAAQVLYRAILDGKLEDGFAVRDVYRRNFEIIGRDKDIAQDACDELVKINALKEKLTPKGFQQKEKIEYYINPKIFTDNRTNENPRVSTMSTLSTRYLEKNNFFDGGKEDLENPTMSTLSPPYKRISEDFNIINDEYKEYEDTEGFKL